MKKTLFALGLCGLFLISSIEIVSAQNTQQKKETKVEKKEQREARRKLRQAKEGIQNITRIEALNFSFYPNTVEPEFGISHDLDGDFYFTVDKDVMYMNLPYIGRFYITPASPENIPINLTSSKFLYFVHTDDEITFHVTIIPSDPTSLLNQGIQFNFYLNKKDGSATLKVSADNRQEITYTGSFN